MDYPAGKVAAEAVEMGDIAGAYSQGWVLWLLMCVQKCYAEDAKYSTTCTSCFPCFEHTLKSGLGRLFSGALDCVHNSVVGARISTAVGTSKAEWKRYKFCPESCKS